MLCQDGVVGIREDSYAFQASRLQPVRRGVRNGSPADGQPAASHRRLSVGRGPKQGRWSLIAQMLPGPPRRTEHGVRNRYNRLMLLAKTEQQAAPGAAP